VRGGRVDSDQLVDYQVIPRIVNLAAKKRIERRPIEGVDLKDLPKLQYFAENENAATLIREGQLYYHGKDGVWKPLPVQHIPEGLKQQLQGGSK